MKNYLKIVFAWLIMVMMSACKTLVQDNPSAIAENEGVIIVRSTGTGSNQRTAMIDAEQQAFKDLFFRGYPTSQQKVPMIGVNENALMQQHKAYFDQFFVNRYRTFLIRSKPVGNFSGKQLTMDVTINIRALRTDLEQNGIIRKFGY